MNNKLNYNRYSTFYNEKLRKEIIYKNNIDNTHKIPKLTKIIIQSTSKNIIENKKQLISLIYMFKNITGQKPFLIKSKKNIAAFNLRKNALVGVKVILQKNNMYNFLDNFITLVMPKLKYISKIDYNKKKNNINYNISIPDINIFNEIEYDSFLYKKQYGLSISFVFEDTKNLYNTLLLSNFKMPILYTKNKYYA